MDQSLQDLAKTINAGPAVLLIGQTILNLGGGADRFLDTAGSKTGLGAVKDYNDLIARLQVQDREATLALLHNISSRIAPPSWLERVASVPWNAVLTSSFLDVVDRPLRLDWRNVEVILNEKRRPEDVRSRRNLHLFKLFGCVSRNIAAEEPPLSPLDLLRRQAVAGQMLAELPFLVTPQGVLLIEAYTKCDWLKADLLSQQMAQLADKQAHLFSTTQDMVDDPAIHLLVANHKLVLHEMPLVSFLEEAFAKGLITVPENSEQWSEGTSLTIGEVTNRFSEPEWRKFTQGLCLLDDRPLNLPPDFRDRDERYEAFRQFLYGTHTVPDWTGFAKGFAFRRDEFDVLLKRVRSALGHNSLKPDPVIVSGQSGVGKSVALADLAFTLRRDHAPVVFLGRNCTRIDGRVLDAVCLRVEQLKDQPILIVWDARLDFDDYSQLARFLAGRGRKALVVGAAYKAPDKSNSVEFSAAMSPKEQGRLVDYLQGIDPDILGKLGGVRTDAHFLAALYRLLPESRANLRTGLLREFEKAEESIQRAAAEAVAVTDSVENTIGAMILNSLPPAWRAELRPMQTIDVHDEAGTPASFEYTLSGMILVPARYGQDVPVDLVLRCLGSEGFERLRQSLQEADVYRWVLDDSGNDFIGARHAIEARIICEQRFSLAEELRFIGLLVRNLRLPAHWEASSTEVEFAVRLLRTIGPDGEFGYRFPKELGAMVAMLTELRESNRNRSHPRLLLLEGHLRREEDRRQLQDAATPSVEQIVRSISSIKDAQEVIEMARSMLTTSETTAHRHEFLLSMIHTELATLYGICKSVGISNLGCYHNKK